MKPTPNTPFNRGGHIANEIKLDPLLRKALQDADENQKMDVVFYKAHEYAQGLNTLKAHGHDDWHVQPRRNWRTRHKWFHSRWLVLVIVTRRMGCLGPEVQQRGSGLPQ
jgi:hypothetical protein